MELAKKKEAKIIKLNKSTITYQENLVSLYQDLEELEVRVTQILHHSTGLPRDLSNQKTSFALFLDRIFQFFFSK